MSNRVTKLGSVPLKLSDTVSLRYFLQQLANAIIDLDTDTLQASELTSALDSLNSKIATKLSGSGGTCSGLLYMQVGVEDATGGFIGRAVPTADWVESNFLSSTPHQTLTYYGNITINSSMDIPHVKYIDDNYVQSSYSMEALGSVTQYAPVYITTTTVNSETLPVVSMASTTVTASAGKYIGIALTSAETTEYVGVRSSGYVTNTTWSWSIGSVVYVGDSGLTSTKPTTGYVQKVGIAINPTTILLQSSDCVIL